MNVSVFVTVAMLMQVADPVFVNVDVLVRLIPYCPADTPDKIGKSESY